MRLFAMWVMAIACACGGKDKPIPTCEELVAGLKSQLVGNQTPPIWTERCHADGWSDEIRRCFGSEVTSSCLKQLTDQQRGALMKATMTASERENEREQLARYATDAFPRWASTHPNACPEKLTELDPQLSNIVYLTSGDNDEWKHPRKILCGDALPKQAKGMGVVSMGPDGVAGNADDVHSWDPAP